MAARQRSRIAGRDVGFSMIGMLSGSAVVMRGSTKTTAKSAARIHRAQYLFSGATSRPHGTQRKTFTFRHLSDLDPSGRLSVACRDAGSFEGCFRGCERERGTATYTLRAVGGISLAAMATGLLGGGKRHEGGVRGGESTQAHRSEASPLRSGVRP